MNEEQGPVCTTNAHEHALAGAVLLDVRDKVKLQSRAFDAPEGRPLPSVKGAPHAQTDTSLEGCQCQVLLNS